jgi:hypothetical protein
LPKKEGSYEERKDGRKKKKGYRHKLGICYTYRFYIATIFANK